jgi:hypothetical protein
LKKEEVIFFEPESSIVASHKLWNQQTKEESCIFSIELKTKKKVSMNRKMVKKNE